MNKSCISGLKKGKPDHTDHGNMPVFIKEGVKNFYGLPQINHGIGGVKIGGHIVGEIVDPDKRSFDLDEERKRATEEDMLPYFPHLEKNSIQFARCLYEVTPDERFIIGIHPNDKRVIIGAGFCGAGFKHGSVVGKMLTQLVRGEKTEVNISGFDPSRFIKSKL